MPTFNHQRIANYRAVSLPLAFLVLIQSFVAMPMAAQSTGPSQPEFEQVQVVGADNLVDPFTGNFKYAIPLFEIGGFPITLSYSSDHKMDDEASWVGFGWTLNPGAISRQVRGIPDDFRGDEIVHEGNMEPIITSSLSPGADVEVFGAFGIGANLNFSYNNFSGFDFTQDLSPNINLTGLVQAIGNDFTNPNSNSESTATGIRPYNEIFSMGERSKFSASVSANINSRLGLEYISFSSSYSRLQGLRGSETYGGFTYTPVGEFPKSYTASSRYVKIGGAAWPISGQVGLNSQNMIQSYELNVLRNPAYGYLYLEAGQENDEALLDYNVERNGILPTDAPRLAMPFGTPDIFSVSGIGMAGKLSLCRNEVGVFRPVRRVSRSRSTGSGNDASFGGLVHVGVNANTAAIENKKGGWTSFNGTSTLQELVPFGLKFAENAGRSEAVYFSFSEANAPLTDARYQNAGGSSPLFLPIGKSGGSVFPEGNIFRTQVPGFPFIPATNAALESWETQDRQFRTNQVTYLTNAEAAIGALEKELRVFAPLQDPIDNNFRDGDFSFLPINRVNSSTNNPLTDYRADHHLSEIKITNPNGQRFVYGLPVYNFNKREVTFDASGLSANTTSPPYGTVTVQADRLEITTPTGEDQFYDEVTTPAHTTAHMLTSILSPDYVDVTNDGPTLDDLGQYVHFSYSAARDLVVNQSPFLEWRVPNFPNLAAYHPGNHSDEDDDRGSFSSGEKEVYYVHHIDSKTHRAVFITSLRDDIRLLGEDANGNSSTVALRKLDAIKLFTLSELEASEEQARAAIPLKTIHFEYADNAESVSGNLPGAANVDVGKLTLSKVSFSYQENARGKQNPYEFTYKLSTTGGSKEEYVYGASDRWGNQRPVTGIDYPLPQVFPYTIQDQVLAEQYCDLGNLESITLPSGGKINVEYEPDDYAYVQDKRAGRMFEIIGVSSESDPGVVLNSLYSSSPAPLVPPLSNLILHVAVDDLPLDGQGAVDVAKVKRLYFEDVQDLFFDVGVILKKGTSIVERVKGYARFDRDNFEALPGSPGQPDQLRIRLEGINLTNKETNSQFSIHPFAFAGIQKMRLEIPELVYDIDNDDDPTISAEEMWAILKQSGRFFQNFYKWRTDYEDASTILPEESFARLADPSFAKIGDGSRVKTIKMSDEWLPEENNGQLSTEYTQLYTYTTSTSTGDLISSGVAANEPMIGREENLLVNVEKTTRGRMLAPNETYFLEGPVGMQFYPGPQVGYSEVSMEIDIDDDQFKQSKPGRSVYEFYTARDFPVITIATGVDRPRVRPGLQINPIRSRAISRQGLSQGFSIQINDMHGKMEATKEYGFDGGLISKSIYKYAETTERGKRRLENLLPTSLPDGLTQEDRLLGLSEEIWIESTEEETNTKGFGVQVNLDFQPAFLFAPSVYPNISNAETSLHTVTSTKLITRKGILKEVEVTNNGSTLATKNLRWDALTGAPLLTSTENEYEQPIYSMNLPAYYMDEHAGMGPAYENEGATFKGVLIDSEGRPSCTGCDLESALFPGDEVLLDYETPDGIEITGEEIIATVVDSDNNDRLITEDGSYVDLARPYPVILKVLRSGQRNMLAASAGQTSSLIPPDVNNYWGTSNNNTLGKILASSATTFRQNWWDLCNIEEAGVPSDPNCTSPSCQNLEDGCDACAEGTLQSVQTALNVYFNSPFNSTDDLVGFNLEDCQIQALIDCDSCIVLFNEVKKFGLVFSNQDYVCQNGEIEYNNAIPNYIATCSFIEDVPWLEGTDIPGDQICNYGDYSSCQDVVDNRSNRCASNLNFRSSMGSAMTGLPHPLPVDMACQEWSVGQSNPYVTGRLGNWRVHATSVYQQEKRNNAFELDANHQPLVYRNGALKNFIPFWSGGTRYNEGQSHILARQVINYDTHGNALETIDAVMIPSAKQLGFHQQLTTAVAGNTKRIDLGFESFEDHKFVRAPMDNGWERHFRLFDRIEANGKIIGVDGAPQPGSLTGDVAHTGKYSYQLAGGSEPLVAVYSTRYKLLNEMMEPECDESLDPLNCINQFAPGMIMQGSMENGEMMSAGEYYVSCWVANDYSLSYGKSAAIGENCNPMTENCGDGPPAHLLIECYVNGSWMPVPAGPFIPEGPTVEGWQQLSGTFKVANSTVEEVRFSLHPSSYVESNVAFYFDDFRVHPREASVTTYAYDYETLRLMAQMDDNGYATFYEYDDEGKLVRLKRETEKGIMTVTEQQMNLTPRSQ